jgi:hypothetical protein
LKPVAALAPLLALTFMASCFAVAPAAGAEPSVQFLVAPAPGDTVYYVVPFSWKGTDFDGSIDHYRYAIDPTPVDSFWIETNRTERSVFFLSNQLPEPLSLSGPDYFFGAHSLVVEAVDNEGLASAPAARSFVTYTVAPEAYITSPVPNHLFMPIVNPNTLHIEWNGVDWDGVFSSKPVKYKFRFFSKNSMVPAWDLVTANPDTLRRYYAPAFAGWDSVGPDSAQADYSNLVPLTNYLFCVVGFDEAGAYSPRFSLSGNMLFMLTSGPVSVDGQPTVLRLEAPRPNPAGAVATLDYAVPREGPVDLEVFDAEGRRLRSLAAGTVSAGNHHTAWDLADDSGRRVNPGLYVVRLRTRDATLTRKLMVVR